MSGFAIQNSLVRTLEVETDRLVASALQASTRREGVMKDLFHDYWTKTGKTKVFLRFGRNHLHRGYDRRGVSTLGNCVAELAASASKSLTLPPSQACGKIRLFGPPSEFDERTDDPAFAY